MAGDWIKIEKATPDKPEIRQMARLTRASKGDTFAAFFRFYAWADEQTNSGLIKFIGPEDVDQISGLVGFGKALEEVGWISFSETGAVITNWERHNGRSAKARVVEAEKKRHQRAAKDTCPDLNGTSVPIPTGQDRD